MIAARRWDWFVTLTVKRSIEREGLEGKFRAFIRRIECEGWGLGLVPPETHPRNWSRELRDVPTSRRLRWSCAWERQQRGAWHLHLLLAAPRLPQVRFHRVIAAWHDLAARAGALTLEHDRGVNWLVSRDAEWRGARGWKRTGLEEPGWCDVKRVRSQEGVAAYCAKYVAKGGDVVLSFAA